jgi:hypothetical protein
MLFLSIFCSFWVNACRIWKKKERVATNMHDKQSAAFDIKTAARFREA